MTIHSVYSDLDPLLKTTLDGNIKILYDEDVVIQSIKTIMATVSGERVRSPIGASLVRYLFEPMDADVAEDLENAIYKVIRRYEPRVEVVRISVQSNYDNNYYDVLMHMRIKRIRQPVELRTRLRSLADSF